MKKFIIILVNTIVFTQLSCALFAQTEVDFGEVTQEELAQKTYPLDSMAQAAILYDAGKSYFTYSNHAGLQLVFERHTRIKIYGKDGYDWANVEIPIYKSGDGKEEVTSLKGYTYNLEGGNIDKTKLNKKGKFEEKLSEHWDNVKFTMPNVKEGAIIEYVYQVKSDFLFNLQEWYFQYEIPVVWSEYKVKIPQYLQYKQLYQGYIPLAMSDISSVHDYFATTTKQRSGGDGLRGSTVNTQFQNNRMDFTSKQMHWGAKDVPALREEKYITTMDDYVAKISFELASVNFPGAIPKDYTTSWENVDKELLEHSDFGGALKKSNAVKNKVDELVADAKTDEEKIQKISHYLKNNIKFNDKNACTTSQSLKQTLEVKSGNAADINLLLVAMLREAGLTAEPVALSTRGHGRIRKLYPMLQQFNYVIAMARVNDQVVLLDATEPFYPENLLPVRCLNGEGRIIGGYAGDPWVKLNTDQASVSYTMVELSLEDGEMLKGKMTRSFSNYNAVNWRKNAKSVKEESEAVLAANSKFPNWEVSKYGSTGIEDLNESIREEYQVSYKESINNTLSTLFLDAMVVDRLEENPFKTESRVYPVDFAFPTRTMYILNLMLPEGYVVDEYPQSEIVSLPEKSGLFSYTTRVHGNILNIVCKLDINKSMFLAEEYPYLREFMERVVSKQSEKLVIKKL